MNRGLYSIHDSAANYFNTPFFYRTDAEAIRAFKVAHQGDTPMGAHPADFTLFCIGSWDMETGVVTPETPRSLGNLLQLTAADGNGSN